MNNSTLIQDILQRGVTKIIVKEELQKLLESSKKIRVYLGIDPTGSDLHLGHAVPLRKLKKFQELGHEVILLFGGFTAQIGDPTGRDTGREPLSLDKVMQNAKNYIKQASTILDFEGKNKVIVKNNFDWLSKMTFEDVVKLAGHFTVQQMIERDMFEKRIAEGKPVGLHEFLYPLMQGYDSVAMDVDLEIAGNDQLFNTLAGRTLQEQINGRTKHCMTFELLEGTDGRKMSKTFNNHIPLGAEPKEMFGKIMSIKDELIIKYFELATELPLAEIKKYNVALQEGENPRNLKLILGETVVSLYHSAEIGKAAKESFISEFTNRELPTDIPSVSVKSSTLIDILLELKVVTSKGEGKRLIEQGGVTIDNEKFLDSNATIKVDAKPLIKAGKRKYFYLMP